MRILIVFTSVNLACASSTSDTSESPADDTAAGGDAFLPRAGIYATEVTMVSNDCGAQSELSGSISGTISDVDADSYGFLLGTIDADIMFTCSLTDSAFGCAAETSTDYASWGWSAVLVFTHGLTGSWLTESEFEGELSTDTTCTGSECSALAEVIETTLPCSTTHTVRAVQE